MHKNKFNLKNKKGIVLIGMAGAGKSTVGKILAKKLGFEFIDGDKLIEDCEKMKIQDIINIKGEYYFSEIEENLLMRLAPMNKKIISPGGSIVYSKKLMDFFRKNFFVIWLDVPFFIIEKRVARKSDRKIIFRGKKTLKEVFYDRRDLYKKYFDVRIDCRRLPSSAVIKVILEKI
ncbi:MAG: Shikimate kinase [Parcubacteria group bacterium GW2011_GWC1_38_17]|nr:MAG: Shikimate kinase [Parcubacteria group bacterium GW2011_GWC1_38_17]